MAAEPLSDGVWLALVQIREDILDSAVVRRLLLRCKPLLVAVQDGERVVSLESGRTGGCQGEQSELFAQFAGLVAFERRQEAWRGSCCCKALVRTEGCPSWISIKDYKI